MTDSSSDDVTEVDPDKSVRSREKMLHSEVMPGITTESDTRKYTARVKRGGVKQHDQRFVSVSYTPFDGSTTRSLLKINPREIPALIRTLNGILDEIETADLRVPPCIYCGEDMDSVAEAETHHEEQHEDRAYGNDFEPEYYQPDPNDDLSYLRTD